MTRLAAIAALAYATSLAALMACGLTPAVPWEFLPALGILALPAGLTCALILGTLPDRLGLRGPTMWEAAGVGALGLAVMLFRQSTAAWFGLALGSIVLTTKIRAPRQLGLAGAGVAILALGYMAVWNVNYLAALTTPGRLRDEHLVGIDKLILGLDHYASVFPLTPAPALFQLFESAYLFLFSEIVAVLAVVATAGKVDALRRWLAMLFGAYGLGLTMFMAFPTVGPHIFAPGSFDSTTWGHTQTWRLLERMTTEYTNVLNGSSLNGFGYFVGAPSLHVAVAALCQHRLRQWPWMFWTFLPVNVLLIASTVVLGYHYVVDVPAGLALAAVIIAVSRRLPRT